MFHVPHDFKAFGKVFIRRRQKQKKGKEKSKKKGKEGIGGKGR